MRVPLLDLKIQYQSLKEEIDKAIQSVVESQYFILGPEVQKFESSICEYLNCKKAVGVSSGTDALLLALMAIDIQPGDEIILPTYSFFATAGVVSRMKAVPVFVDSDPVTFNIDPGLIKQKITEKTKAIIPVHLYGQSADMDPILEIAKKHKLKVIEDAAQAIGVQYKDGRKVGTIGDIGCFSFFPSKNLGGFGDAGIVTTNNEALGEKMKLLRVHGMEPKYYHKMIGGNFRIDALQAAVLSVKLPHLDSWSAKRRSNAELYTKLFIQAGLAAETGKTEFDDNNKVLLPKAIYQKLETNIQKLETSNPSFVRTNQTSAGRQKLVNYHIYNQFIIRVEKRDELLSYLREKEIGVEIYYPVPFHRQECFADLNNIDTDFPVANFAAETSLALPIYPELTEEQIKYVVESITEFII